MNKERVYRKPLVWEIRHHNHNMSLVHKAELDANHIVASPENTNNTFVMDIHVYDIVKPDIRFLCLISFSTDKNGENLV